MKNTRRLTALKERIQKNAFLGSVWEIVRRSFRHNIFGMAAELAYYLLFCFLPLIIFGSSLIGLLNFDMTEFSQEIARLIPEDIMNLVRSYLDYVQSMQSPTLMYMGLVLSIYFASSAMRSLMRSLNKAYDVHKDRHPVKKFIISFFFSIVFLVLILLSMLILLAGGYIVQLLIGIFPQIEGFQWLINLLRFTILILPIWGVLILLYRFTPNRKLRFSSALPGAVFSTVTWMVVSAGFSFYVSDMARYSFLYGSLGAIIVLMLWLYITGMIFILGGELNFVVMKRRERREKEKIKALLLQERQTIEKKGHDAGGENGEH